MPKGVCVQQQPTCLLQAMLRAAAYMMSVARPQTPPDPPTREPDCCNLAAAARHGHPHAGRGAAEHAARRARDERGVPHGRHRHDHVVLLRGLSPRHATRAAAAAARGTGTGLCHPRRSCLGGNAGTCVLGASGSVGVDASALGCLLRGHLRRGGELAQSPRLEYQPRSAARHLHARPVRGAGRRAIPAGALESAVHRAVHAGLGADLGRDGADRRLGAGGRRACRAAAGAFPRSLPQLPARGGSSGLLGHDLLHHFLNGTCLCAAVGFRHARRRRVHGGQHPGGGAYPVSGRTAFRPHGPAHGDREHVSARHRRRRLQSRCSARCRGSSS